MILNHERHSGQLARETPECNWKHKSVNVDHVGIERPNNINEARRWPQHSDSARKTQAQRARVVHEFVCHSVANESLAACCSLDYRYPGAGTCRTRGDTRQSVPLVEQCFTVAPRGVHIEADLDRMGG